MPAYGEARGLPEGPGALLGTPRTGPKPGPMAVGALPGAPNRWPEEPASYTGTEGGRPYTGGELGVVRLGKGT